MFGRIRQANMPFASCEQRTQQMNYWVFSLSGYNIATKVRTGKKTKVAPLGIWGGYTNILDTIPAQRRRRAGQSKTSTDTNFLWNNSGKCVDWKISIRSKTRNNMHYDWRKREQAKFREMGKAFSNPVAPTIFFFFWTGSTWFTGYIKASTNPRLCF